MISQTEFRAGLLDPETPAPLGLQDGSAQPSGKRYDVYRNNVTHALISSLTTAFPLVHKLVGPRRFAQIAPLFVRAHPPTSPLMMFYGAEFPEFLAEYAPLHDIGYLADAARFDCAMRRAYHAADAPVLAPEYLQALAPEDLMTAKFAPAPATQILCSPWPLYDIWRVSFEQNAPNPRPEAQNVLIARMEFDPAPHLLPVGAMDWLTALANGQTFGEATQSTIATTPDFDLEETLTLALTSGALTDTTVRN